MSGSEMVNAMRIDVLMISYNRPAYTERSLTQLLETCDDGMRVWIWQNGSHPATLGIVTKLSKHPRVHRFHHSQENKRLREPTNWFWDESDAPLLSKIDDDNPMPEGWGTRMREAHSREATLGVIGAWPFLAEDIDPKLVSRKLQRFPSGPEVMLNCWVGGTGYVMKRSVYEQLGPMKRGQSFTNWCILAAAKGWKNGYLHPFIIMDNLDDPRHPECQMKSQQDFEKHAGLSLTAAGVQSFSDIESRITGLARGVLVAPYEPNRFVGVRAKLRRGWQRGVSWMKGTIGS